MTENENHAVFDGLASLSARVKASIAAKEEKDKKAQGEIWQRHLEALQKHMDDAVEMGHGSFSLDVEKLTKAQRAALASKIFESGKGTLTIKLNIASSRSSDNSHIVVKLH